MNGGFLPCGAMRVFALTLLAFQRGVKSKRRLRGPEFWEESVTKAELTKNKKHEFEKCGYNFWSF
jgi:hypothetical protein